MRMMFTIRTKREEMQNITAQVQRAVTESGVQNGICFVYCPHTTAAITINENADPDVVHDFLLGLNKTFPDDRAYLHEEGNSTAHLKSSCVGCSEMLPVENGKLVKGIWQDVYFCEFDGPRTRTFYVSVQ